MLEAAAEARRAAEAHGVDIGTLAIKESVAAPGVAVHLMGMKTVEEVSALPYPKPLNPSPTLNPQTVSSIIKVYVQWSMPADSILTVEDVSSLHSIGILWDVQGQ